MERRIKHYSNFHQILLVGEGDFSFSLALANVFESAENLVTTSLDSREKVISSYTWGKMNLENLERHGAMILHGIDATKMDKHEILREMLFDIIVFNFPHAGFGGSENNDRVIKKHSHLVKMFFNNARNMLSKIGEIHVTHKVKAPYNQWKVVEQAEKSGLLLKKLVEFNIADYPGYTNRRGAAPKMGGTFSLGECRTYIFILGSCFHDHVNCDKKESMETPNRMPKSSASVEILKAVVLELEFEKERRKASETAKEVLEASLTTLKTDADKLVKERDILRRQIDKFLHKKDDALREKAAISKKLAESLSLKEDAVRQRDVSILELESERKRRKASETAKEVLEASLTCLKTDADKLVKERDELRRQIGNVLHQKDDALREKAAIFKNLAESLRLKEDAVRQRDVSILEHENYKLSTYQLEHRKMIQLVRQKDDALFQKEEAYQEKAEIAKQLGDTLRWKEEAIEQIERILKERDDLGKQKNEINCWSIIEWCGLGLCSKLNHVICSWKQ